MFAGLDRPRLRVKATTTAEIAPTAAVLPVMIAARTAGSLKTLPDPSPEDPWAPGGEGTNVGMVAGVGIGANVGMVVGIGMGVTVEGGWVRAIATVTNLSALIATVASTAERLSTPPKLTVDPGTLGFAKRFISVPMA